MGPKEQSYVKKVFFERFEKLKSRDTDFEERFQHLGELTTIKIGPTNFDWDKLEDNTETLT